MKRTILLSALILVAVLTFGQTKKKDKNFDLGVEAFNSGNYDKAIDYFTLSITKRPTTNAIVNRAISYYYISDSCNFCTDLQTASGMGDTTANKLYMKSCTIIISSKIIPDSIKFNYPSIRSINIIHTKCNSNSSVMYTYEKNGTEYGTTDISKTDNSEVFTEVEEMPTFVGGEKARNLFLIENKKYPEIAKNAEISGTSFVQCIIEKDGSISDVLITRGIGGGCDEEAIRVVKLMPKWNPGKQLGHPVRVLFIIPIDFILNGK